MWTGHIHALQRSCVGVVKGNCLGTDSNGDALGPLHIMTGGRWGAASHALHGRAGAWGARERPPPHLAAAQPRRRVCCPSQYHLYLYLATICVCTCACLNTCAGNAGFQSPLQTFDKAPGWLAYSSFDYGFTEVTATRTSMTLKVGDGKKGE